MANRSQGATAAAAAAGDNGHDDDDAVVCLDGTATTEGLSSLYSYVPTQDEIRTALKSTKIVGTMDKKKQELAAAGLDPMRSAILRRLNNKDKTAFETALPIKNPAKAGDPCELKLSSAVSVATSWMAASAIVLRLINDTTKWSRRDGTALREKLCVVSDTLEEAIEAAKTQVLKDKQAGTAYKDDGPGGTECPYCKCQCTAAYDVSVFVLYVCLVIACCIVCKY